MKTMQANITKLGSQLDQIRGAIMKGKKGEQIFTCSLKFTVDLSVSAI